MPASKDIVMRYFVQEADNLWKCSCGKVLSQKKNTGFTNLFNHIKSQHPEYASSGSQPSISSCFALAPSSDTNSETSIDFAATLLKKRKIEKAGSQYMNVKFILPTSNLVERFFSSATYSFGDLRQSLLPMNLEMQLFLKINQRFWNEQFVASIVA